MTVPVSERLKDALERAPCREVQILQPFWPAMDERRVSGVMAEAGSKG